MWQWSSPLQKMNATHYPHFPGYLVPRTSSHSDQTALSCQSRCSSFCFLTQFAFRPQLWPCSWLHPKWWGIYCGLAYSVKSKMIAFYCPICGGSCFLRLFVWFCPTDLHLGRLIALRRAWSLPWSKSAAEWSCSIYCLFRFGHSKWWPRFFSCTFSPFT